MEYCVLCIGNGHRLSIKMESAGVSNLISAGPIPHSLLRNGQFLLRHSRMLLAATQVNSD